MFFVREAKYEDMESAARIMVTSFRTSFKVCEEVTHYGFYFWMETQNYMILMGENFNV